MGSNYDLLDNNWSFRQSLKFGKGTVARDNHLDCIRSNRKWRKVIKPKLPK